jgi:cell division protein FtsQ
MLQRSPRFQPAPALPLPLDVRLMNSVAGGVFVLAGVAVLATGLWWLSRLPLFTLKSVQIEGELTRNSVNTLRANALPALQGNFFSLKLADSRAAFESVPWVRHAVVRRVWPDRLRVRLEEHRPAALWVNEDGNDRLVNSFGEVFEANLGDVEDDGLPRLQGPEGTAAQMLALLQRLQPVLAALEMHVSSLQLSGRGSWRVELDSGATLELGRGSDDEVLARTERFARTLGQLTARYRAPLLHADLRHTEGYAVRLRGVTTLNNNKSIN